MSTDCGVPPSPKNGYVTFTSTTIQSTATYHCKKDHKLLGFSKVYCLRGGKWSGVVPLCRSKYSIVVLTYYQIGNQKRQIIREFFDNISIDRFQHWQIKIILFRNFALGIRQTIVINLLIL